LKEFKSYEQFIHFNGQGTGSEQSNDYCEMQDVNEAILAKAKKDKKH
jgi:hypothetical protein